MAALLGLGMFRRVSVGSNSAVLGRTDGAGFFASTIFARTIIAACASGDTSLAALGSAIMTARAGTVDSDFADVTAGNDTELWEVARLSLRSAMVVSTANEGVLGAGFGGSTTIAGTDVLAA